MYRASQKLSPKNAHFSLVDLFYCFGPIAGQILLLFPRALVCPGAEAVFPVAAGFFRGDPGRSIADPFSVVKMKVPRNVTPREVNRARSIGLIEGGVIQGLVARKFNISRTAVNHS